VIGVGLGVAAGYFGGRIDQAVSYLLTCQLALPGLLLAMSSCSSSGPR
jgi:peptide/nickel transport system permease protein